MLAPVAFHKIADPEGELATARAVSATGIGMVLSTMATCTVEDVSGCAGCPKWFQLYVNPDREATREIVQRVKACGFKALCLTVDVPYLGRRERDFYNSLQFAPDIFPANFVTPAYEAGASALTAQAARVMDPALTWKDVEWLREMSRMPLLLKGVLTPEDALLAVEHGCAGVIVSNHGARQLDGVPAPIEVLPEIAEAVAGRIPLLVDGGIRRGTDIVKALALGAQATLIGRPYIWALAAEGEAGVTRAISMLRAEFELAMALCGCRTVEEISRSLVRTPT
jgi:isopentenyl diphosphate isomerase/L-lactate dehydrogenase-like FMN-dependent dehydrogenase